jgi:hypothetical protein
MLNTFKKNVIKLDLNLLISLLFFTSIIFIDARPQKDSVNSEQKFTDSKKYEQFWIDFSNAYCNYDVTWLENHSLKNVYEDWGLATVPKIVNSIDLFKKLTSSKKYNKAIDRMMKLNLLKAMFTCKCDSECDNRDSSFMYYIEKSTMKKLKLNPKEILYIVEFENDYFAFVRKNNVLIFIGITHNYD